MDKNINNKQPFLNNNWYEISVGTYKKGYINYYLGIFNWNNNNDINNEDNQQINKTLNKQSNNYEVKEILLKNRKGIDISHNLTPKRNAITVSCSVQLESCKQSFCEFCREDNIENKFPIFYEKWMKIILNKLESDIEEENNLRNSKLSKKENKMTKVRKQKTLIKNRM